ncbi:MAG: MFS transporter [Planctomycetota bacterium]|jgi:MFS family permease
MSEEQDSAVESDHPTPVQQRGMRDAILTQCFLSLAFVSFSNSFLLVYFKALAISEVRIISYLSLDKVITGILLIPAAYLADRYGKKRLGMLGAICMAGSFAILTLAAFLPGGGVEFACFFGIAFFGVGSGLAGSSWFALLRPLVPASMRGRFFGRLRFTWTSCGLVFSGLGAWILSLDTSLTTYEVMLLVMTVALCIRLYFYRRIPELDAGVKHRTGFGNACMTILRGEGIMSFCAYSFLITLFTAGGLVLFGMVEKSVLGLSDDVVVWMGNISMIGGMVGFLIGGKLVDRFGTKPAFLLCHFAYGAVLVLFLVRGVVAGEGMMLVLIGTVHFLFGLVTACGSIALSTETLALIPQAHQSLAAAVCSTMLYLGRSLSGFLAAWVVQLKILRESWTLCGQRLSSYDAILFGYAVMVVLLVITLGLVPSVIRRSELLPRT